MNFETFQGTQNSCGEHQKYTFDGNVIEDDMLVGNVGLADEDTIDAIAYYYYKADMKAARRLMVGSSDNVINMQEIDILPCLKPTVKAVILLKGTEGKCNAQVQEPIIDYALSIDTFGCRCCS